MNKIVDDLKHDRITNSDERTNQSHGTRHREQTIRAFKAAGNRPRRIQNNDPESSKTDAVEDEIPPKHLAFRWENRAAVLTFQGRDLASVEQSAGAFSCFDQIIFAMQALWNKGLVEMILFSAK